jgi:hypothetical protein
MVTTEWLSEVLGAAVASVETTSIGTGQMAISERLTLTYADGATGPAAVVLKRPSDDPRSRMASMATGSYRIETSFYRDLAPTLPVRAPGCLAVEYDDQTDDFRLLLEDLAPSRQGDQITGCTPDEAAIAVEHLPLLHGPRWGDPGLAELDWLHRTSAASATNTAGFLAGFLDSWAERYDGRVDEEIVALARRALPKLPGPILQDPSSWTVQHGDYRLDNLLFGTSEGGPPVAVVDWQTVVHGPGIADLSYFIGAGLPTAQRRVHEEDLVRRYQAGMAVQGVALGWDDLWRQFRQFTMAGLAMAIGASMLVEQTDRGDDMFMAMADRHGRHALDLEVDAVLE